MDEQGQRPTVTINFNPDVTPELAETLNVMVRDAVRGIRREAMSEPTRRLSNIKWQATGVDGHTHHTCGEWQYTSDAPPVEADEYERMKQRAEAAERERDAWKQEADDERKSMRSALRVMQERAETAEASIKEWTARRKPIPLDALLVIEEIAPLIAHDKLSDPAAWMKAWDQVSPWLAALNPDKEKTTHE